MPIQGYVHLTLRNAANEVIRSEGHNQVVYLGRHRASHIIFGDIVPSAEKAVNTLKIAGGAATSINYFNPTAVAQTDSGMFETNTANIYSIALPSPVFNATTNTTAPTVSYTVTLTSTQVNLLVNEIGVFFGSTGPIFAHYSFSTIDLRASANNSLEITWQFIL
jgi:hypothetical protein